MKDAHRILSRQRAARCAASWGVRRLCFVRRKRKKTLTWGGQGSRGGKKPTVPPPTLLRRMKRLFSCLLFFLLRCFDWRESDTFTPHAEEKARTLVRTHGDTRTFTILTPHTWSSTRLQLSSLPRTLSAALYFVPPPGSTVGSPSRHRFPKKGKKLSVSSLPLPTLRKHGKRGIHRVV